MRSRLLLLFGMATGLLPGFAWADGIYRYVEKDGTVVYTNVAPGPGTFAKRLGGRFHRAPRPTDKPRERPQSAATELDSFIVAAAHRYRIPVPLVWAVMHAESNFDRSALSQRGASGLMQLMPDTAQEMYVKDIFDARDNIEGGTRYLRILANQYDGDMVKMIAAYNAGPEALRRYGGRVPPFPETQAYVRKVLELYFQYKDQGQTRVETASAEDPGT